MSSLNKVYLVGRLGQDPELRYTANQTPVCTFSMATTEVSKRDGEKHEHTEWHKVVCWNKRAENVSKYLSKGKSCLVEGQLRTRSWEDKNTGQKRYATEIIASNVQFLSPKSDSNNGGSYDPSYGAPASDDEIPF